MVQLHVLINDRDVHTRAGDPRLMQGPHAQAGILCVFQNGLLDCFAAFETV